MPSRSYDLILDLQVGKVPTLIRVHDERSYRCVVELFRCKAFGFLSKHHFALKDTNTGDYHALDDSEIAKTYNFIWSLSPKAKVTFKKRRPQSPGLGSVETTES